MFSFALQKHAHVIYWIFFVCKNENLYWKNFDIFLVFAQNITSTHNLCFGLHTQVLLCKSGVQGGIYYKDMFL